MRRARVPVEAGFGGLAALVALAGPAWACLATISPVLESLQPSQVQAGAQVVVTGEHWSPASAVQLHWQSAAGVPLGSAIPDAAGAISQPIVVPTDAGAATYYVVAVQGSAVEPSVLQVVAPGAVQPSPVPSGEPTPVNAQPLPVQPSPVPPGKSTPVNAQPAAPTGGASVLKATPAQPAALGGGSSSAVAQAAPPSSGSPASQRGPASPAGAQSGPVAPGQAAAGAPSAVPRPLTRQGIGDLWSGFAHGDTPSVGLLNIPGSSSVRFPAVEVAGVLAALAAMAGGFGIAELRRARAYARAGR